MKLSLLVTLAAGAGAAAILSLVGGIVEGAAAAPSGPAGPAVQTLRAQGLAADPAPSLFGACRLPIADRLSVCPIDATAAEKAATGVAPGTAQSAELVSLQLTTHGRALAWAVTVRRQLMVAVMCPLPPPGSRMPTCAPPGPVAVNTLVVVDARSGGQLDCASLRRVPGRPAQHAPALAVVACRALAQPGRVAIDGPAVPAGQTTSSGSSRTGP